MGERVGIPLRVQGSVTVGQEVVVTWSAQGRPESFPGSSESESRLYECVVERTEGRGFGKRVAERDEFEVRHWPSDGEAWLAQKVLFQFHVRRGDR